MKAQNLIALLLFLAGAMWALTRSESTVRSIQRSYYTAISPFLEKGSSLESKASELLRETEHSEIWKTRYQLAKDELDKKRMEVTHLRKLEAENARLNQALQFQQEAPFHVLAAKIIRRQPSTWWQTVTINRGEQKGVGVQLPVLAPEGLVGKIDAPSKNTSTVILLTDEKCQVSAKVDGTPEVGILSGQRGQTGDNPDLRLSFLSKDAKIKPGKLVFTTGRGGLFPPDILLGTVKSFEPGPLYGEALVKPAVDFATLHTVFVKIPAPPESAR
ncbi:rod shape-determining protein MreC [Verrucomicrobiaceae bacterium N1E253]|uniref:Cell shape-determining protein MreC n=1 Tax=Oceaniferula marina TaxID=2748318 RepID=A0A851GF45_9BACT|nr:rod shape-determining protein MreC [Oceaniferula marina]NWK56153.1 rod shape-determining protein MreC [Oceaniferula marina]